MSERATRPGRSLWPRSLRRQLTLALVALAVLFSTSVLVALVALETSARTTHRLAERSVASLQDAHALVSTTLLVERESRRLASAESADEVRESHAAIDPLLHELDALVQRLAVESGDISVLTLHQAGQLFRNAAHTLGGLRENVLLTDAALSAAIARHTSRPGSSAADLELLHRLRESVDQAEIEALRREFAGPAGAEDPFALRVSVLEWQAMGDRYGDALDRQAVELVASAQRISAEVTQRHRRTVDDLARRSIAMERWVVALLAGSLLLAWLVSRFLERHVLARLQAISHALRQAGPPQQAPRIPVQGDDEIGEMARAVEQFMEDRRELAAAHGELEAFSYSVAHDLRAPLRAIDGYTQILRAHEQELGEEARSCLETIRRNVQRMSALIDDLLKLSRVSRGELTFGTVDMAALAREAFEESRATVPERKIELRVGRLPEALGDEALLRQVLANLIGNAVKFTGPRAEAIIEVNGAVEDEECVYGVTDNGVGFDMAHAQRLFGAFERLHSMREFEGTGIGLAIVKRVVERHGGRVWAEGRVGEGARFQFTLPCRGRPSARAPNGPRLPLR